MRIARAHVGYGNRLFRETRLELLQHRHVKVIVPVKKQEVDICIDSGKRLRGVAGADLDEILEPCGRAASASA